MSASLYEDKLIQPSDQMLSKDLEDSKVFFEKVCVFIKQEYGDLRPEWKFYNKKSGWILKLFNKKRNVLFIVPAKTFFKAVFTFGDRASELIFKSKLPESIKNRVLKAKKYAEGRTIQLEVKNKKDYENILRLINIKLSK